MADSVITKRLILEQSEANQILKVLLPKLKSIKETKKPPLKITVMPDFFVDRIIEVVDYPKFVSDTRKKILAGGGSMRGYTSIDIKGGNAVNVAYCLAKLGVNIDLYTIADKIGTSILQSVFDAFGTMVNLHIKKGKHGLTTVFEFLDSESYSSSNVMISDVGDNDNFGPDLVESDNLSLTLESADAIIITNWASNMRGTDLLKSIFTNSPNSIHFLDPADIEKRCFEFINTLRTNANLIHYLSINENEFNQLVEAIQSLNGGKTGYKNNQNYKQNDHKSDNDHISTIINTNTTTKNSINEIYDIVQQLCIFEADSYPTNISKVCKSVKALSNYFNLNVCLHTTKGCVMSSSSVEGKDRDVVFVTSIVPSRIDIVSGAGDSWNAGFMFGHLHGFKDEEKLCFANLLASLHVENVFNDDPSLSEVIDHIQSI
ncbi:MAG: hypothetical protein M3Y25_09255 [Thermoproteota archaeon]|nr:hypothetical protein [Thermoproteota archaeon]